MWGQTINNIGNLFNPEAEARGAAVQSSARYNNARALAQEDQNSALAEAVLAAAGYTPQQIAGIRATRPSGYLDISKGVSNDAGRAAIAAGDYRQGIALTSPGDWKNFAAGDLDYAAVTDPTTGKIDSSLAAVFGQGVKNEGGNTYTWDPVNKTYKVLDVNPQGQSYLAGGQAKTDVAGANVNKINTQATAIKNLSEAQIADRARLTDAQIDDLVNKGANRDLLTLSRTQAIEFMNGLAKEKNDALIENIKAKTAGFNEESAARINRTNSLINLDAVRGQVALLGDPVKKAQAEATLYRSIENHYAKDFSENLGNANQWEKVDPLQKKSLSDRALEYMRRGDDFGLALAKSEKDHGLTGKMVRGQKTSFFGLRTSPDGKVTFEGFTAPSELAAVVSDGSTPPVATPPVMVPPVVTPPVVTPPAAPVADASTPRITDDAAGREAYDKLPVGAVYVAPDGSVLTKK
jgi:hypothetical protein